MKDSENEDSDFLRDKLFSYEEPADDNAWERLRTDLDNKNRRRAIWWWMTPLVLLLLAGSAYFIKMDKAVETQQTSNRIENEKNPVSGSSKGNQNKETIPSSSDAGSPVPQNSVLSSKHSQSPETALSPENSGKTEGTDIQNKAIEHKGSTQISDHKEPKFQPSGNTTVETGLVVKTISETDGTSEQNEGTRQVAARLKTNKRKALVAGIGIKSRPEKGRLHSEKPVRPDAENKTMANNPSSVSEPINPEPNATPNPSRVVSESEANAEKQDRSALETSPGGSGQTFSAVPDSGTASATKPLVAAIAKTDSLVIKKIEPDTTLPTARKWKFRFSVHGGVFGIVQEATANIIPSQYEGKTRSALSSMKNSPAFDVSFFGNLKRDGALCLRLGVGLTYWQQTALFRQKAGLTSDVQFQESTQSGVFSAVPIVDPLATVSIEEKWLMPWLMPQLETTFGKSSPIGIRAGMQMSYRWNIATGTNMNNNPDIQFAGVYSLFYRKSRWEAEFRFLNQKQGSYAIPGIEKSNSKTYWLGFSAGYWF